MKKTMTTLFWLPLCLTYACGGASTDDVAKLSKKLDAALTRINTLEGQLSALQGISPADIAGLTASVGTLTDNVTALQTADTATNERIDITDSAVAAIDLSPYDTRLVSLETKTQSMRIGKNIAASATAGDPDVLLFDGMDVVFTGLNVSIQNGKGLQNDKLPGDWEVNGKGNLTIGYNKMTNSSRPRTGSHNLILGYSNSYSSWGAIIAGTNNQSLGIMASILGGGISHQV